MAKAFLDKSENVLCAECVKFGRLEPSVVVDHIIPIRFGGAKRDERNLQGLCKSCHGVKTAKEVHGRIQAWKGNEFGDKIPI